MSSRAFAVTILVVGVLLFLVAAAADPLGIGANPGFGLKQLAGMVVGVALAAVGMVRLRGEPPAGGHGHAAGGGAASR